MSLNSNSSTPQRPLKGSWEASLFEAQELARRNDDRTVAAYWRLIDRLAAFASERRHAGSGRLQLFLEEALFGVQSYLAKRGRFHEAADVESIRIEKILDGDALAEWTLNRAKLLSWQEKNEAALDLLFAHLNQYPLSIPARWLLFDIYIDANRVDEASAVIDDLESAVQGEIAHSEEDALSLHKGLIWYLRSVISLTQEAWDDAFTYFECAAQESDAYADNWHMLYRPLIFSGQHVLASRALNREESEASQRFWRGLSGHYAGDTVGSKIEWEQVTQLDIEQVWVRSAVDWILAHYFLGDEKREGLELALRLLNRPDTDPEPTMLIAAALGWSLRGEWGHVRSNLDFALAGYRANLQDLLLPKMYGVLARALMDEEHAAQFQRYFRQSGI
ncbi:hypothetical protein GC175_07235 [bacterium]|nr:hypothetical protein [bacterium]